MSLIPFGFWKTKYQFLPSVDYPTYGWSFWRRNPNYNGSCIRVRRNSDNTEQDIGFKNNFLDTAAMLSFVGGSGNGFLVTFYDQFGSINLTNVFTGNNGYMPAVVSAGQLITFLNGTPTIQFGTGASEGYTQIFGGSGVNMIPNTNSTLFWSEENGASVANQVAGNSNNNSVFARGDISGASGTNVFYDWGTYENYFVNESIELLGGYNNQTIGSSAELYEVKSYRINQQGARLMASRGIGYNALGTGFVLGGRYDNSNTFFRGKCNEFLIYAGTTLSESKVRSIQSVLNNSHQLYNTTSVTSNLILWYDAGNTTCYPGSGTSLTDLSVAGANGTLVNGVTYSSADGGKFILDGINDWIGTTGTNNYPWNVRGSDFTIEAWVKFSNTNHAARILSSRNNGNNTACSLAVGQLDSLGVITANRKISLAYVNESQTRVRVTQTTNDIIDGGWKHIIATRTNFTYKIYVNGVEQATTTVQSVGGDNPVYARTDTQWRVADGGTGVGGNGAFEISIMRLYKCALDQTQVTRNYNLEKSRYGL